MCTCMLPSVYILCIYNITQNDRDPQILSQAGVGLGMHVSGNQLHIRGAHFSAIYTTYIKRSHNKYLEFKKTCGELKILAV